MNLCHSLNGAAAMTLVRHAARHGFAWTLGGARVSSIGWRWGDSPGRVGLVVTQAGTERVCHQAHAHQAIELACEGGALWLADLSVAQFGRSDAMRCVALPPPSLGTALSPTLGRRAARGIAPALLGAASDVGYQCRHAVAQTAVERTLGALGREGFPLCEHMMPAPLFGSSEAGRDLIEEGVCSALGRFEAALERASVGVGHGVRAWSAPISQETASGGGAETTGYKGSKLIFTK